MDKFVDIADNHHMATNFAGIGNILRRHTENADSRFDIRRHEPEQERRRKKDDRDAEKIRFDIYDNATVSVEALRVFLENFLKSLSSKSFSENLSLGNPPGQDSPASESPVSAQASHAARQYRTAAETAPKKPAPAGPAVGQELLSNEEVRAIYRILENISLLQVRRIDYLTIEKGETFLASLDNAAQKALQ